MMRNKRGMTYMHGP